MAINFAERNETIRHRYLAGETIYQLAEAFGITKQRISDIVSGLPKHYGDIHRAEKRAAYVEGVQERKKTRKAKRDEIIRLYNSGLTQSQIAEQVGTTQTQVSAVLTFVRPSTPHRRIYHSIPEELRRQVVSLSADGMNQMEIATKLSISQTSVSKILRRPIVNE